MADDSSCKYFLVSVAETVTACYPVAANSEDEARRKVLDLVESGFVPHPSESSANKRHTVASECRETTLQGCEAIAPSSLSEDAAAALLLRDCNTGPHNDPSDIARTAKFILEKTGSGALKPCTHRRF